MINTGVVNGRFQVLHFKHMEYLLAAKMRCRKLYIGLTNPDSMYTRESVNDEDRSARSANPLSYYERCQMIRGALTEFNVPETEFEFVPFPINRPEYILQYLPKEAVYFVGMFDAWDEEKYKILRSLELEIEILWRKTPEEKGVSSAWIRSLIATGEEWSHLVPKSVFEYLTVNHLDKKIKRLEMMRIEEKEINLKGD